MGRTNHGSMLDYLKVNILYECEGVEEMVEKLRRSMRRDEEEPRKQQQPVIAQPVMQAPPEPQLPNVPVKTPPTPVSNPYQLMGDQVYAADNSNKAAMGAVVDPNQRAVLEADEEDADDDEYGVWQGRVDSDSAGREPARHQRRRKHRRRRLVRTHFRRQRRNRAWNQRGRRGR
jgi:hypothetical protein